MQTITKDQIEPILGKTSFWFPDAKKQLVAKTAYISGIDVFGELDLKSPVNIKAKPNGLLVEKMKGLSFVYAAIMNDEIRTWTIESQEQIYEQKEKSVVGRALIGGLLLGPVGALIGGMSGIGTKTVRTSETPENILTINHIEGVMLFGVADKNLKEVKQFFEANYLNN